eukprot:s227_g2.t1
MDKWAELQEAYLVDTDGKGFTIPAGSLLVRSSAGTSKWVMPDQISKTLRPSSSAQSAPSSSLPPGSPDFAKGEKIQVWSESRQVWLLGVVQEVFLVDSKSEGFDVPAGSVKVLSETGVKWVLPKDRARMLQKVEVPSSLDLKAMLKAALSQSQLRDSHVESREAAESLGKDALKKAEARGARPGPRDSRDLAETSATDFDGRAVARKASEVFEDFPSLKEMEELLGGEPQVLRDLAGWVAQQVAVDRCHVEAALHLLQDGASVHFIASYRKEMTGCMKEQKLHDIEREMNRGLALETRRRQVALELQSRGQLSEQRKKDLLEAGTAEDLDDIWAPFQHAEGASMDLGMGPQLCGPVTAFISALWCIAE